MMTQAEAMAKYRASEKGRSREVEYMSRWRYTEAGQLWVQRKRLKKYGLTPEEYQKLLIGQGGVCAICGQEETATIKGVVRRLAVDHDHQTDEVRGLLCYMCNSALGHFGDNPDLLRRALNYLTRKA